MSDQNHQNKVDLSKDTATGAAGIRIFTKFNHIFETHPKGKDHVTEKLGPFTSALISTAREANVACRAYADPTAIRDVFDVVGGVSWVMVASPAMKPSILRAAIEEANIAQNTKTYLLDAFDKCPADHRQWALINAFMLMGGYEAVQYAAALMNEFALHMEEIAE